MNETALKERLKAIAQEKEQPFNQVWKQLLLERFLARLSISDLRDHFIFKGGLLLAQRIDIGRETTDVDLLIHRLKAGVAVIEAAFRRIVEIDARDGFTFVFREVQQFDRSHMDYGGFRVILDVRLDKMRDAIQIDVGVGDRVSPIESEIHPFEYKGKPIFGGEITLLSYPVESIFAEKLETLISKGSNNSRMKDYHDLILMIREDGLLNVASLKGTISETFSSRGTRLQLPIGFEKEAMEILQRLWLAHLKGLGASQAKLGLPEHLRDLLNELNSWISGAM